LLHFKNEFQTLILLPNRLRISIERHKAELRRAANDEKLFTVAKRVSSDEQVSNEWIRYSTRLIPLLASESTDCLLYKSNEVNLAQEQPRTILCPNQTVSSKKLNNRNELVEVLPETSQECLEMKRKINKSNRSLTSLLNKIKEEMATFEDETKCEQNKQTELKENKLKEETSESENSSFIEKLLKKHKVYLKEKIKRDEHEAQLSRSKCSNETNYIQTVAPEVVLNKAHQQPTPQIAQSKSSLISVNHELKQVKQEEIKMITAHQVNTTPTTPIIQNKNISSLINPSTSTNSALNSNYTFNGSSMVIKLASPRVNANNTIVNAPVLNVVGANRPVVRPVVAFPNLNQKVILVQNNNPLSSSKICTTSTMPNNPITHINLANSTIKSLNIQSFDQQQQQQPRTIISTNTKTTAIADLNLSTNK